MTDPTDDNPFEKPAQETPGATEHPSPDPADTPPPSDPSPSVEECANEAIQALKEKATDAFKSGTGDAREAFEKSFPQAKEDIAKGINDASYAIGYAVSFGSALVKEFSPDNVTDGFERGSDAGNKAAEEVIEHRKARSGNVPEDPDPSMA